MTKNFFKIFYIVLFLTTFIPFSSCRYSNSIIRRNVKVETIHKNDTTILTKSYDYFRISNYGIWGEVRYVESRNQKGQLLSKEFYKRTTNQGIRDGRQNYITKITLFKDGRIYSKTKRISKIRGRGGKSYSKTLTYNNDGKLTEKIIKRNHNEKVKKYNNK